ncbi:MAG: hypothetical protein AAF402_08520 [Pseudomonadota bacterium]
MKTVRGFRGPSSTTRLINSHRYCTNASAVLGGLVFILISLASGVAHSAVILKVDFDSMVRNSELVFEGVAARKWFQRHPEDGRPMTYIRFKIREVIKGTHNGDSIDLAFEGGTIDGVTMLVSDLEVPIVGERGIYFVESTSNDLANPLYGWHQGHYLISQDDGGNQIVKPIDSKTPTYGSDLPTTAESKAFGLPSPDKDGELIDAFKQKIRNVREQ